MKAGDVFVDSEFYAAIGYLKNLRSSGIVYLVTEHQNEDRGADYRHFDVDRCDVGNKEKPNDNLQCSQNPK